MQWRIPGVKPRVANKDTKIGLCPLDMKNSSNEWGGNCKKDSPRGGPSYVERRKAGMWRQDKTYSNTEKKQRPTQSTGGVPGRLGKENIKSSNRRPGNDIEPTERKKKKKRR